MFKLAAQMYTVRKFTQTPKDIAESCRRVKAMGYDGIQISAFGPIDRKEMKAILDGEGLECAATHVSLDRIENDFDSFIEDHLLWTCMNPAIGGFFPGLDHFDRTTWDAFIERFNRLAQRVADAKVGMRLGYHNHTHEFVKLDGEQPYFRLIRELNPATTWFEVDVFWASFSGVNPSGLIRKVAHRIPLVHFKDLKLEFNQDTPSMNEPTRKITEVGDGNLNWPEIVEACRYAGTRWLAVERDDGDLPPFESLQRSIDNLHYRMGL